MRVEAGGAPEPQPADSPGAGVEPSRWRRHPRCTAQPAKWAAPLEAPQLAFEGTCNGGDRYVIHLVQLGPVIHQLQVDGSLLEVGEPRRCAPCSRGCRCG